MWQYNFLIKFWVWPSSQNPHRHKSLIWIFVVGEAIFFLIKEKINGSRPYPNSFWMLRTMSSSFARRHLLCFGFLYCAKNRQVGIVFCTWRKCVCVSASWVNEPLPFARIPCVVSYVEGVKKRDNVDSKGFICWVDKTHGMMWQIFAQKCMLNRPWHWWRWGAKNPLLFDQIIESL
jgi:hypothetical protein